ncbi:MAG: type II secretion system F family protein, partial [Pseudomonadota bacterium]
MPEFHVKAFGADGRTLVETIDAADPAAALAAARAQGLTAFAVDAARIDDAAEPWWKRDYQLFGARGPNAKALLNAWSALADLLEAGLPVRDALRSAAEDAQDPRLRAYLGRAAAKLSQGAAPDAAFADDATIFPARHLRLFDLGFRTNRLAKVARNVASALAREIEAREAVSSALVYPVMLMVAAGLVFLGLIFFLAPALEPVFLATGAAPPAALSAMLAAQRFLVDQWAIALAVFAVLALGLRRLLSSSAAPLERLRFRLPLFGKLLRQREAAAVANTLGLMLESGAPLLEALENAARSAQTQAFQAAATSAAEAVRNGGRLGPAFEQNSLFPNNVARLIALGERTNRLGELALRAAQLAESAAAAQVQAIVKLLPPILTL